MTCCAWTLLSRNWERMDNQKNGLHDGGLDEIVEYSAPRLCFKYAVQHHSLENAGHEHRANQPLATCFFRSHHCALLCSVGNYRKVPTLVQRDPI